MPAMKPYSGGFPAGISDGLKAYYLQRVGDNYAMCYVCGQPVWQDVFPSDCMECSPPKDFASVHAHYLAEIATEAAKEAQAIADAAAAATAAAAVPAATTTPTNNNIATAINNLFNNHLIPAIANEPAHWATLNTANATEAQLKQEMHDHYSTLTASGAKTNWLNRIRNKANNVEKLDAFMDVLINP